MEGFFTIVHYEFQFDENPTTKLLKTLESIFFVRKIDSQLRVLYFMKSELTLFLTHKKASCQKTSGKAHIYKKKRKK